MHKKTFVHNKLKHLMSFTSNENMRGLSNKTVELLITVKNVHSFHILCLTEHHMKLPKIVEVNLNSYTPGTGFCRRSVMK
jgi:hypothetical protein